MGVIHKLKPEIVEYILNQKKNDPSLSCRQIANFINVKFNMNISKSSVNSIMKEAQMSSTVGRRALEGKAGKFQIPIDKKQQLFKDIATWPDIVNQINPPKERIIKKIEQPTQQRAVEPLTAKAVPKVIEEPTIKKTEEIQDPVKTTANLPTDINEIISTETSTNEALLSAIEQKKQDKIKRRGQLLKGMGYILLKAAKDMTMENNCISSLLALPKSYNINNFEAIADAMFFLYCAGVKEVNEIPAYNNDGLWLFCGLTEEYASPNLFRWWNPHESVNSSVVLQFRYSLEQDLMPIYSFNLILSDGTAMVLDPKITTAWIDAPPKQCAQPLKASINLLSRTIISNNEPVSLYTTSSTSQSHQTICDLLMMFSGLSNKRIMKIELLDEQEQELITFTTIPNKKKIFNVGIFPWHQEFTEITKAVRWAAKDIFFDESTENIYYYNTTTTDYFEQYLKENIPIKVITVWSDKNRDPLCAILSNGDNDKPQDILKNYLANWPYLDKNSIADMKALESKHKRLDAKTNQEILPPFSLFSGPLSSGVSQVQNVTMFNFLKDILHDFVKNIFFASEFKSFEYVQAQKILYELPGYYSVEKHIIYITLCPPKDYRYMQSLNETIHIFNELNIRDLYNRRLFINKPVF